MTKFVLKRFKQVWRGEPVLIKVGRRQILFGQGEPRATVHIKNSGLMFKLLLSPSLTFAESYMSGDITIDSSTSSEQEALITVLEGFHASSEFSSPWFVKAINVFKSRLPDSIKKAAHNAHHHYDLGNDFYKLWLDKSMTYTCAYFKTADDSIDLAQEQKRERIMNKLKIQPGQTMLDIGCGWGSLLFYAAEKFGCVATGITAAAEQAKYIEEETKRRGLAGKVKVIKGDWREVTGSYDRAVSIGMFEAVGYHQFDQFFKRWHSLLKEGGISLLHTIGSIHGGNEAFMDKYIFPGGYLPSLANMAESAEVASLKIIDQEDLWQHYVLTLKRWYAAFQEHEGEVKEMFDDKFIKMWTLYLQGSQAGFSVGQLHLWQLVMIKDKLAEWPLDRTAEIS